MIAIRLPHFFLFVFAVLNVAIIESNAEINTDKKDPVLFPHVSTIGFSDDQTFYLYRIDMQESDQEMSVKLKTIIGSKKLD
jgi:hypothetical protein